MLTLIIGELGLLLRSLKCTTQSVSFSLGLLEIRWDRRSYPYYGAASLMDYVDDYILDGKYLLLGGDGTVVDTAGYPILQYVWCKFGVNIHAHIITGENGFNVESLYMLFKRTPVRSIITGAVQANISQVNL